MEDRQSQEIRADVRPRLIDYVALQLWCRWVNLPRMVLIYLASMAVVVAVIAVIDGTPLKDMADLFVEDRTLQVIVVLGFAVIIALPVVLTVLRSLSGKLTREMQFVFGDAGIRYVFNEADVTLPWSSASAWSETAAALYIRTKRIYLRVPKRDMSADMLAALRTVFESKGLTRIGLWRFR